MRSTRRWSSTPHEDRPATAAPGFAHQARRRPRATAVTVGPMGEASVWLERRVIAYAHQGGAWESPSSTLHAIAHALEVGRHGHRARRPRHGGRRAGGLPRRHGRPHHGRPGHHRVVHAGAAPGHGLLLLVDPRRRRHAGAARRPTTRSAAGRRPTGPSASPPCARSSSASPGWC